MPRLLWRVYRGVAQCVCGAGYFRHPKRFLTRFMLPKALSLGGLLCLASGFAEGKREDAKSECGVSDVLVGTYTQKLGHVDGKGRGLYRFTLDHATGVLSYVETLESSANPTWLVKNPDPERPIVYILNELYGEPGSIEVLELDKHTQQLKITQKVSSYGSGTCHGSISPDGRLLSIANYEGGVDEFKANHTRKTTRPKQEHNSSVVVYNLHPNGTIGEVAWKEPHPFPGSKVVQTRQMKSHAHCSVFVHTDADRYALLAPDLGLDDVRTYLFDKYPKPKLISRGAIKAMPGAGPRHLCMHPKMNIAYVVNELDSSVSVIPLDNHGHPKNTTQVVGSLPNGFQAESTTAEILFHPSGSFVYVSNRVVGGEGIISCFKVDKQTGRLQAQSYHGSGGVCPRAMEMFADGRIMVVLNQDSDSIVSLFVDGSDGSLKTTGFKACCPSPVAAVSLD